ncbi:MAG: gliding motility-associated C-terminal domain-containing protein, partial [Cytophagaceae bacterium]
MFSIFFQIRKNVPAYYSYNKDCKNHCFLTTAGKIVLFLVLFLSSNSTIIKAEGTKQLLPASTDWGYIEINNSTTNIPFATWNGPVDYRLNFTICDPAEIVYLGFQPSRNNVYYRIKNSAGTVVMGPAILASAAGVGYIQNYTEAVTGPSTIAAGGYNPMVFNPGATGDYYIEFNAGSSTTYSSTSFNFPFFDITVTDPAKNIKLGRLWSKAWEFTTGGAANQFKATMYVYSTDGIVTSLNFNGMQPQGFAVSCNSKGCANTGSTNADRQSRVGPFAFPEYKIFLNEPDVACFPTGTFGNITNAPNITGCGGNRCINIQVDKAGQLGVLLDLNGVVGYQPGTIDRLLQINAVLGMNCVPWDGKDGLGNPVLNGVNISMQIDFYNGLTHLPLYDVENQINGFIVGLVRPAGPAPRLFWDDTQLPAPQVTNTALDGILNLTGCLPASPTGCHRWKNRGINSCVPNCPESINTWWYANIVTQNIPYTNIAIIVDANINRSGFGASNDTTGCALATPIPLHGFVNGATGGLWSSNGTGTFSPSTTSVSAFYTPSAADLAAGNVKVKLTSTGNGLCPAISDSMQIFFTPPPTANSGGNQSICKNNPNVTLNGSFTLATGVKWTGGAGAFAPNNTTKNGTYTPTATEISNGTPITLTLTTTGNGVCPAASSPMTISFTPSPVANAGSDVSICSTTSTVALSGSISNATGAAWTGAAGGSFAPSATALNCTYTLSAAEIAAGSTNITLQTTGVGNCKQVTDTMKITVIKAPTVNAGGPQSVCGNNPTVTLSGGSTNASGVTWTGGAGIYTPNANAATGTYKLTTGEVSAGGVTLTLTAAGNAPCSSVTDQAVISINASPTAVINPSAVTVCANNPSAALSAAVTVATGGTWSVGSGTFLPNTNSTSITYTPSAAEVSSGLATLIFTTTGNGNCKSASDTILISILAAPFVDAGPDQTLCGNKAVATLAGAVAGATSKSWSGGAGIFSNPGLLNATYTPTAAEISAGSVTLTLTASRASCNNVTDQVTINFTPAPTADAGGNQTLCANNASVSLNGSLTVASGAQWSGGAGSFNPSSTALNATYTPTAAEITSGVTLTLTTSGNGNCNAVSDPMSINFTPAPTVNPGATQSVCANNPTTLLNGSVTVATGGTWSGGGGTFAPDATLLNTSYIPSAAEVTAGLVTLTLTSTGNGSCNPVSGNLIIDITPKPTVNAGGDKTVCADNPSVNLSATISVAGGGIWTGGSGTFSPSASSLTTTYQPTTAEILAGSVSLTLTSTGNLNCNAESDDMTITITPAPIIDAGPDMTVCGASTSIKLNGSVQNAGGGTWSSAGNGSFSPSASTAGASYLASATDISNGSVSLTFTSSGNGFCNAVSDNMVITFTNVPNINAGPDDIVCTNKLPIHLNATGSASAWSGGTGTFSPNNSTLNGSYTPSAAEIAAGSVTLTATTAPS